MRAPAKWQAFGAMTGARSGGLPVMTGLAVPVRTSTVGEGEARVTYDVHGDLAAGQTGEPEAFATRLRELLTSTR